MNAPSFTPFFLSLYLFLSHSFSLTLIYSVGVKNEAREGAVFVVVASVGFATIQFDVDFIASVQMQNHTVRGVVIVLISILSDRAGSYLHERERKPTRRFSKQKRISVQLCRSRFSWLAWFC